MRRGREVAFEGVHGPRDVTGERVHATEQETSMARLRRAREALEQETEGTHGKVRIASEPRRVREPRELFRRELPESP